MESFFSDPTFWVAVASAIFFALFYKMAVPVLTKSLDERSDKIQGELDRAIKLREQAQSSLAEYQKKQKIVLKEAEEILQNTKEEAKQMKSTADDELRSSIDRRIKTADDRISRAESQAIADIRNNMVDIAVNAARSVIMANMNEKTDEDHIKLALNDVDRILH